MLQKSVLTKVESKESVSWLRLVVLIAASFGVIHVLVTYGKDFKDKDTILFGISSSDNDSKPPLPPSPPSPPPQLSSVVLPAAKYEYKGGPLFTQWKAQFLNKALQQWRQTVAAARRENDGKTYDTILSESGSNAAIALKLYAFLYEKGQPFVASRIGKVEGRAMSLIHNNMPYKELTDAHLSMLNVNAGVYPETRAEATKFAREYGRAMAAADNGGFMGVFKFPGFEQEKALHDMYCPGATYIHTRGLEPFYHEQPWTTLLRGKTLLVVHPFAESIRRQYDNYRGGTSTSSSSAAPSQAAYTNDHDHENEDEDWLFTEAAMRTPKMPLHANGNMLPKLKALKLVKSVVSFAGAPPPHGSWTESLQYMKDEIRKQMPFDVAILGCGSYGLPLTAFILNELERPSIYMGGGTQLVFGIKGNRWTKHDVLGKMFNDQWVWPLPEEQPAGSMKVEGAAYW